MAARSSIVAPLHVGDDIVGLLCLDYTGFSGRVFQPDDLTLVEALADRLVLVLERAYLSGPGRRAPAPGLDLLAQVSELLTVGLDTRARLEAVADVVLPTFGDACVAYLLGDAGLHPAVCRVADGRTTHCRRAHGHPEQRARRRGSRGDCLPDPRVGPRDEVPPGLGEPAGTSSGCTRSSSCPCSRRTSRSAFWGSATRSRGGGTGRDDLGLAREIAARVAPAVEDAMRFERELATAEALQRSLLPDQLPELQDADLATRYVPGGVGLKVGGDWYDAVRSATGGSCS